MGASGSGTTTLGRAIAARLGWAHLDSDEFYWLPSSPPFVQKRNTDERLRLILGALERSDAAIVSGSVMGWGHEIEDTFALIAFLTVPADVRVERLRQRETALYGAIDPAFLAWAAQYDEGRLDGRSLARHRQWLAKRSCPVLHLDGEMPLASACAGVLDKIGASGATR